MSNPDPIQEHVMKNVDELDLKDQPNYIKYFDAEMNKVGNTMAKSYHIPFLIHSTCACGCGEMHYQINHDIISKQKAIELLLHTAEIIKKELSTQN